MTKFLSISTLKSIGFKSVQPLWKEPEFSYDWHRFEKNDSQLDFTTEYDLEGNITKQYVDFNGETLKGKSIYLKDLKYLIELM